MSKERTTFLTTIVPREIKDRMLSYTSDVAYLCSVLMRLGRCYVVLVCREYPEGNNYRTDRNNMLKFSLLHDSALLPVSVESHSIALISSCHVIYMQAISVNLSVWKCFNFRCLCVTASRHAFVNVDSPSGTSWWFRYMSKTCRTSLQDLIGYNSIACKQNLQRIPMHTSV